MKFPDATVAATPITEFAPEHPAVEGLPAAGQGADLPWRGRLRPYGSGERTGATAPADGADAAEPDSASRSRNFEGPFDLLLSLIAKHELDITEVSLSSA